MDDHKSTRESSLSLMAEQLQINAYSVINKTCSILGKVG